MVNCELCGKNSSNTDAIVEGIMLKVCQTCAEYGQVVKVDKPEIKEESRTPQSVTEEPEIINNYSEQIKEAREKLNLKQSELAQQLGEKESVIHKLESNKLEPSENLMKKLKQFLNLNLVSEQKPLKPKEFSLTNKKLTIGDILKMKNDNKKTPSN